MKLFLLRLLKDQSGALHPTRTTTGVTPLNQPKTILNTTLPIVKPNEPLPLSPNVVSGAAFGGAAPQVNVGQVQPLTGPVVQDVPLNVQVLQAGQRKAITGFESPVLDLTSRRTTELLQDPSQGFDIERQKQLTRERFDISRAQSTKALRESLADVANLGGTKQIIAQEFLRGSRERTLLETQLDQEANERIRTNLLAALGEGRATAGVESERFATDIGALTQIRGAAEGLEQRIFTGAQNAIDRGLTIALANQDAQLQTDLTELRGKIEQGIQLTKNDFAATQAGLDRALSTALQANDIEAVENIERMKEDFTRQENIEERKSKSDLLLSAQDFDAEQSDLDRLQQRAIQDNDINAIARIEQMRADLTREQNEADRIFRSAERIGTQKWQTGERISNQDFAQGMQFLQQEHDKAIQSGDFIQEKLMFEAQEKLQLGLQLGEFDHEEKMRILADDLTTAFADGDVDRQKVLMDYAATIDLNNLVTQQGFAIALQDNQAKIQEALANNDSENATSLMQAEWSIRALELQKDRDLEEIRIELDKFGVNYDAILGLVESGQIDPSAAVEMIQTQLPAGQTLDAITPDQAASNMQLALKAEFESQAFQFALSHSDNPNFIDKTTSTGLSAEGMREFNKQFNETIYGEGDKTLEDLTNSVTGTIAPEDLEEIRTNSPTWTPETFTDGRGFWTPDVRKFKNPPAKGGTFNFDGQTYEVLTNPVEETSGQNYEYFTAKDLATNTIVTIKAGGRTQGIDILGAFVN